MTESPLIVSPSSLQPSKTKPSEIVSTADVCLQTSAGLSSPRSCEYLVLSPPKEMAQENEGSVTSETVNVEVITSQVHPMSSCLCPLAFSFLFFSTSNCFISFE